MTLEQFFTEFKAAAATGTWVTDVAVRRIMPGGECDCPITAVARARGMHAPDVLEWEAAADYLDLGRKTATEIVCSADAGRDYDHELRERLITIVKGAQS